MILVLTNSKDATADYLLGRLAQAGLPYIRFDTDVCLGQIEAEYRRQSPRLRFLGNWYVPDDFSVVWYRRPEALKHNSIPSTPEGKCTLDEWSEALEGFFAHIPSRRWVNHPAANALASRKIEQLTIASQLGLIIPETLVTQCESDLREFYTKNSGRVIVKPLGKATVERDSGDRDSIIYANPVSKIDLEDLSDLRACPTLFQQLVDKIVDVRITIVDSAIHAVELTANDDEGQQRCDIRRNNMQDVSYRVTQLPGEVDNRLRHLVEHYGLRFAAIDMVVNRKGEWIFLEVNPNGQWAWMDLCEVTSIYQSFLKSFSSDSNQ